GVSAILFGGMATTVMQLAAPAALRGRVMALHTLTVVGMIPLGQLTLGALGSVFGLSSVFLVAGCALVAAATYGLLRVPALRDLRSGPARDETLGEQQVRSGLTAA